jgi:hypothetical protein
MARTWRQSSEKYRPGCILFMGKSKTWKVKTNEDKVRLVIITTTVPLDLDFPK